MHPDPAPTGANKLLVRTLRGIEPIVAAEIEQRLVVRRTERGHREVRFQLPGLPPALLNLGTVDDVFLVVRDDQPIGHSRPDLVRLQRAVAGVDLGEVVKRLSSIRAVAGDAFDVSASFLGRRNYSRYDIEDAVGETLQVVSGWRYVSRRTDTPAPTELSLRAHLTSERTTIAVRIAARALHRRSYRVASRPGALHPPLARALAQLAAPSTNAIVLDPFCGTGTIPIETQLGFPDVQSHGADIDPGAVAAAQANAATARLAIGLVMADAGRLPFAGESIDAVVTNPPWGARVQPAGLLRTGLAPFWGELVRTLRSPARVVILAPGDLSVPTAFAVVDRIQLRLAGARVEIVVIER